MNIKYNTIDLKELDSCPDPRLLIPDLLKKVGKIARLKICESEKGSRDYVNSEILKLKEIINTISTGISADNIEKIEKVTELFEQIDKNQDGDLSELTNALKQVTQNTSDLKILKDTINRIDNQLIGLTSKTDDLLNRVSVLEDDAHDHEITQKSMICQLSKNMIQAFNSGLMRFEEEMNRACDVVLSSPSDEPPLGESTDDMTENMDHSKDEMTDDSSSGAII